MRQNRSAGPATFAAHTPSPWMKWVFVIEAAVLILAAIAFWEMWESAQNDLGLMRKQLKAKTESCENDRREQENTLAYLNKYEKDPDFKLREGRQRLGFAQPGEVVFRLDPAPAPTAPPPPAKAK